MKVVDVELEGRNLKISVKYPYRDSIRIEAADIPELVDGLVVLGYCEKPAKRYFGNELLAKQIIIDGVKSIEFPKLGPRED